MFNMYNMYSNFYNFTFWTELQLLVQETQMHTFKYCVKAQDKEGGLGEQRAEIQHEKD